MQHSEQMKFDILTKLLIFTLQVVSKLLTYRTRITGRLRDVLITLSYAKHF